MIKQQVLWDVGIAHVSPSTPVFMMTNSMLLSWTLDSVPLPLVTKPKFVAEALQWSSERRAQVQSYFNQTELTSELNLNCNYSRTCLIRHRLIRLIRYFFVGPSRIPIFCVHFCSPNSPLSNSPICSIRHLFLSLRNVLFG